MVSPSKIIFRNAFFIFIGIVGYFILMKTLGLDSVTELRYLNVLFVLLGTNSAIQTNIRRNKVVDYFNNIAIALSTALLSVGITIVSLIIYVTFIDPALLSLMQESYIWVGAISLPLVVFALSIEGIASCVICSFILMQYYKNHKIDPVT